MTCIRVVCVHRQFRPCQASVDSHDQSWTSKGVFSPSPSCHLSSARVSMSLFLIAAKMRTKSRVSHRMGGTGDLR